MKVAIAGGHGKIALRLTRLLNARGDSALALVRNAEHADDVRAAGGEPIVCDLEVVSAGELAEALDGAGAVVFAAGAGPGSGPARKETMDYGGAVKLIAAAKIRGIARYVMISSRGADPNARGDDTFVAYLRAKGRADADLVASGLDYTIVKPTRLTDEAGDGRVLIGDEVGGSVPRDDVAAVVAATLVEPETIGRVFGLTDGDAPILEAIQGYVGSS